MSRSSRSSSSSRSSRSSRTSIVEGGRISGASFCICGWGE